MGKVAAHRHRAELNEEKECHTLIQCPTVPAKQIANLLVIVLVEVINTGYASAVAVWIVYMAHVFSVIARIARNHGFGSSVDSVLQKFARRHGSVALGDNRVQNSNQKTNVVANGLVSFHPDYLITTNHLGV